MDDQKKLLAIAYGAILSVLAALVTAMLSHEKNMWTRVKTFVAGVSCGILVNIILMNFTFSQGYKDVISTASAAFVSTIWPTLGSIYNKYIKKKFDVTNHSRPDDPSV